MDTSPDLPPIGATYTGPLGTPCTVIDLPGGGAWVTVQLQGRGGTVKFPGREWRRWLRPLNDQIGPTV
jgi:hypothetical protein